MIYIQLIFLLLVIYIHIKGLYYLLTIYQQEHYDNKKLLKTLFTFYLTKKYNYILYLYCLIALINNFYIYLFGIIIGLFSFFFNDTFIVKFKFTKRMIRLLVLYVLLLPFLGFLPSRYHTVFLLFISLISPFYLILINYLMYPIEKFINSNYKRKAQVILKNNPHQLKIAITGSYGKTTLKNFIYELVEKHYLTLKTPASYNTIMGITSTINTSMRMENEIFIVEMGAYRPKEIKEMAEFIKPQIGIITDIGYTHMDTFKTIDNVLNTKCELLETLEYNGIAIINGDNEYLKTKKFINVKDIYTVGLETHNIISACNINIINGVTTFDIKYKDKIIKDITTNLLGKHHIMNILFTYATKEAINEFGFNISDEDFKDTIKKLKPVLHRLSYSSMDNINIYDDSYNANLVGFLNAIDVVKATNNRKAIITPGIVDGGTKARFINETVALEIAKVFDEIYIIDNYYGKIIYEKIKENHDDIILISSFKEAFNICTKKNKEHIVDLLIANDLPDNYLMRKRG